jgi:hypothetical protein
VSVVVFGGWLLNVFPRFFFQEHEMVVFPLAGYPRDLWPIVFGDACFPKDDAEGLARVFLCSWRRICRPVDGESRSARQAALGFAPDGSARVPVRDAPARDEQRASTGRRTRRPLRMESGRRA